MTSNVAKLAIDKALTLETAFLNNRDAIFMFGKVCSWFLLRMILSASFPFAVR